MALWEEALRLLELALQQRCLLAEELTNETAGSTDSLPMSASQPLQGPCPEQRLVRALKRVEEQLGELAAAVSSKLASSHGSLVHEAGLVMQASTLISSCHNLVGIAWVLPTRVAGAARNANSTGHQAVLRLAAGALSLLMGPGRRLMQHPARLGDSVLPFLLSGQLTAARDILTLLVEPCWTDPAVATAARSALLEAVQLLASAAAAIQRVDPRMHGTAQRCPASFVALVDLLLSDSCPPLFEAATAAVGRDAGLQRQLMDGLLYALNWLLGSIEAQQAAAGSRAGAGGGGEQPDGTLPSKQLWVVAIHTLICLNTPQLESGRQALARAGAAAQLLAPAAAVLRLLAGPGISADDQSAATGVACQLLSAVARALLPSEPAVPASPQQLRDAGWAVLGLLPDAAAALRLIGKADVEVDGTPTDDEAASTARLMHVTVAVGYCSFAMQLASAAPAVSSPAQTRAWCHAAEAALLLLPLASRVHHRFPRASGQLQELRLGASNLAAAAANIWSTYLEPVSDMQHRLTRSEAGRREVAAAAAEPLWRLHSAAVRLVHHAASAEGAQLRELHPCLAEWRWYAAHLANTFQIVFDVHRIACDVSDSEEATAGLKRRWQAICAAQAGAVQVLGSRLGLPPNRLDIGFTLDLRYIAAAAPPPVLTADLLAAFEYVVRQDWQAACARGGPPALVAAVPGQGIDYLWERLHRVIVEAEQWPRYAALLLSSGLLAQGLQLGKRLARETDDEPLPSLARSLLATLVAICRNLAHESSIQLEALQGSSASGGAAIPGDTAEQQQRQQQQEEEQRQRHAVRIQAALGQLQQAVLQSPGPNDMLLAVPAEALPQALTAFQQGLLPAATRAAEAMQALWAEPWEQQAALVQLARAAAVRGCAHLRCASLELEGGPAAGQAKGSKRCSGCRVAWYCSTACQLADWRGPLGHKKVCKALAAERQQQREQQQQQAQAAGDP